MMKRILSPKLLALVATALLASPALAQGVQKLGFVNTERVYQESKQVQNITKNLQAEFAQHYAKLDEMQKQGEALQKKVAKAKPSAERDRDAQALAEMIRLFSIEQARLAEEFNLRRNEEFTAFLQQANGVIAEIAKQEGYDLILQDVVFIDPKFDITDRIIQKLNR